MTWCCPSFAQVVPRGAATAAATQEEHRSLHNSVWTFTQKCTGGRAQLLGPGGPMGLKRVHSGPAYQRSQDPGLSKVWRMAAGFPEPLWINDRTPGLVPEQIQEALSTKCQLLLLFIYFNNQSSSRPRQSLSKESIATLRVTQQPSEIRTQEYLPSGCRAGSENCFVLGKQQCHQGIPLPNSQCQLVTRQEVKVPLVGSQLLTAAREQGDSTLQMMQWPSVGLVSRLEVPEEHLGHGRPKATCHRLDIDS